MDVEPRGWGVPAGWGRRGGGDERGGVGGWKGGGLGGA